MRLMISKELNLFPFFFHWNSNSWTIKVRIFDTLIVLLPVLVGISSRLSDPISATCFWIRSLASTNHTLYWDKETETVSLSAARRSTTFPFFLMKGVQNRSTYEVILRSWLSLQVSFDFTKVSAILSSLHPSYS